MSGEALSLTSPRNQPAPPFHLHHFQVAVQPEAAIELYMAADRPCAHTLPCRLCC